MKEKEIETVSGVSCYCKVFFFANKIFDFYLRIENFAFLAACQILFVSELQVKCIGLTLQNLIRVVHYNIFNIKACKYYFLKQSQ